MEAVKYWILPAFLLCVITCCATQDDLEEVSVTSEEVEDNESLENIPYSSPIPAGRVYLAESFDDPLIFKKKWIVSEAKKDDTDENIAKYDELSFKQHIENIKAKVGTRNNLPQKLTCGKWGSDPHTLRSTALALMFFNAKFADWPGNGQHMYTDWTRFSILHADKISEAISTGYLYLLTRGTPGLWKGDSLETNRVCSFP